MRPFLEEIVHNTPQNFAIKDVVGGAAQVYVSVRLAWPA